MSALVLINALINYADGLDFKIHLRSDFNRCGLISSIDKLKSNVDMDDQLSKQITIFENHARSNYDDLEAQLENIDAVWDGKKQNKN